MRAARPSTTAVLPTPGSPIRTGLFFVRRDRICITRSISVARPTTGSSLPSADWRVRVRPDWAGSFEPLVFVPGAGPPACLARAGPQDEAAVPLGYLDARAS